MSKDAASEQRFEEARDYGRASRWVSISGICITVLVLIAFLLYVIIIFAILGAAISSLGDASFDDDSSAAVKLNAYWLCITLCVCLSLGLNCLCR